MNELQGKVALVNGGGRGIGAAIARALAARGADVVITYVSREDKANEVAGEVKEKGRRGLVLRADGADPQAVEGAVDEAAELLGRLDILVNNAGVFPVGALSELDMAAIAGLTVLGRYAVSGEIASVVAFLAGPDAGYITGATINADGGWAA